MLSHNLGMLLREADVIVWTCIVTDPLTFVLLSVRALLVLVETRVRQVRPEKEATRDTEDSPACRVCLDLLWVDTVQNQSDFIRQCNERTGIWLWYRCTVHSTTHCAITQRTTTHCSTTQSTTAHGTTTQRTTPHGTTTQRTTTHCTTHSIHTYIYILTYMVPLQYVDQISLIALLRLRRHHSNRMVF